MIKDLKYRYKEGTTIRYIGETYFEGSMVLALVISNKPMVMFLTEHRIKIMARKIFTKTLDLYENSISDITNKPKTPTKIKVELTKKWGIFLL